MLLIVSIIITAELYSTFKYHMKIGETTRCCSFFLRTHVKISSKISIIEFNIQIKWCIIVTPSREAEKDYQGYFNSPPHKKNHIATPMINTVLFKISTHILTKRMTDSRTIYHCIEVISTHILTKRMTFPQVIAQEMNIFQLTSSRRGWPRPPVWLYLPLKYFNSHPHEEDDGIPLLIPGYRLHFNSHPHEEDDSFSLLLFRDFTYISTHILTKRMTTYKTYQAAYTLFQLTSSRRGWLKIV